MKRLFIFNLLGILFLILPFAPLHAQQKVVFEYDANGQMTKRYLDVTPDKSIEDSVLEKSIFSNIEVYPNPVSSGLNISHNYNEEMPKNLQLFDMSGKLLFINNQEIESGYILDMSEYNSGIYLLKMNIEGKSIQWKIFKQ